MIKQTPLVRRLPLSLLILTVSWLWIGCSNKILEETCKPDYLVYRYRNNIGENVTKDYIQKMTDFIFTKDSVLYRVDENIHNGRIARRPITVPDGEWIIVSYGNLNGGSECRYVLGKTRMSEMSVRVISQPTYSGTYAQTNAPLIGNADRLYYGKVKINVQKGKTNGLNTVELSNVHIWLSVNIKWVNGSYPTYAGKSANNLHARLETVPVEHRFIADDKADKDYGIPFSTPRITSERVSQVAKLQAVSDTEMKFDTYGLRWETGGAPVLTFYDGETRLLQKELPLEKYFSTQFVDLTNTRVQFYQLQILVDNDRITMFDFGIEDWEDGGSIY